MAQGKRKKPANGNGAGSIRTANMTKAYKIGPGSTLSARTANMTKTYKKKK